MNQCSGDPVPNRNFLFVAAMDKSVLKCLENAWPSSWVTHSMPVKGIGDTKFFAAMHIAMGAKVSIET